MILANPFSYYLPTYDKLQYLNIFQSANLHPIGIPKAQEPIVELVAFDRLLNWLGFVGCRFLTFIGGTIFDHHKLKIIRK